MFGHLRFIWRCLKQAWRGCWTKANEQAAVLGGTILFIVLVLSRNWLKQMNWIDAPTTLWGTAGYTAALAAASAILAFLVIFSVRLVLAPARLYWEQHRRADTLQLELSAATAKPEDGPNWPIHELFSYLEPEVLDRPEDNLWEKAGNQIRDAFSLGQLRVWGRPSKTNLGDWIGQRAALRVIEPKYWERAYFTYSFFDATAKENETHCYADRNTGRPAYADLRVNRAEVLKLWPGEPADLAESYPNVRVADNDALIALFTTQGVQRSKFLALLREAKLRSWARRTIPDQDHDLQKLDPLIWHQKKLTFTKAVDEQHINQTFLRKGKIPPWETVAPSHYDVWLNFAELKKVWPDLPARIATKESR
ncbi:MAG TPA: hypothetical protein VFA80_02675 [Xanthobacteraceae bacterium]|nr:hypothetical protein [Xanthobacteraceae bacterium]